MRANYTEALKRRVRRLNDDTVVYVEAIVRKGEDIRRTRAEWEATGVTRTNVEVFDDGAVRLTASPTAKIGSLTGNGYVTDLNYDLPWDVFAWELDESIGADPVLSKVEVQLDRKNNGGQPTFDGKFVLQIFRIHEVWRSGFGFDLWSLIPMSAPNEVLAADMSADQAFVAFSFSATGLTGVPAPVVGKEWRPTNLKYYPRGSYGGIDPIDPIRGRCIVALVRAVGGTNSNVGMSRDSTKNAKDVQAAGTLRHRIINSFTGKYRKITDGTGEVQCQFTLGDYPATGSVQLLKTSSPASDINLGSVQGTLEFYIKKEEPAGTSITSYARVNSVDAWVQVKDGQTPADVGLTVPGDGRYEMKHDFVANANHDVTPTLRDGGITDRIVYDLTEIASLEGLNESFDPISGEVKMDEGRCVLQHTGVKDYRDIATRLLSENNFTDIEIRAYRGHPDLPRDQWLLYGLWRCDDYKDTETALTLTIVSILERLKGRFPLGSGTLYGYLLASLDSDLVAGADFHKTLKEGATAASTLAVSIAASATEESYGFTGPGIPFLTKWPAGKPFTVKLNVTVANANIFAKVRVSRVNASGTVQQSTPYTAEQQLSSVTGYAFTVPGITWNAGATSDRLRVDYSFRNSAGSVQSVTIEFNTTNAEVVTPWTPTLDVTPKRYDGVTIQAAYLDWRDTMIGLIERYRGAPPANTTDLVTYNRDGGLKDVDGKRILERIAQLAGNIVIASQGVIKAVPALRPTAGPVLFFPLETTVIHDVDLGLRARVPEYSVSFGWDTRKRNAFAGEMWVRHQAALDAYGISRIDNPVRRAEDELSNWILGQDLAFQVALPIVQGIGMGFRRCQLTSLIPYPEGELGDCCAVQLQTLTWRDPISGRANAGPLWVLGIIMACLSGTAGRQFDVWLPTWTDLLAMSGDVWGYTGYSTPDFYELTANVTPAGAVTAIAKVRSGQSVKLAVSTSGEPTPATVRSQAALQLDTDGILRTGTLQTIAPNQTLYVAGFAYDDALGLGAESKLVSARITHYEGGTSLDIVEKSRTLYQITYRLTPRDADGEDVRIAYRTRLVSSGPSEDYASPSPTYIPSSGYSAQGSGSDVTVDRTFSPLGDGANDRWLEAWAEDLNGNKGPIMRELIPAIASADAEAGLASLAAVGSFVACGGGQPGLHNSVTWSRVGIPGSWVVELWSCGGAGCSLPGSQLSANATSPYDHWINTFVKAGATTTPHNKYRVILKNSYGDAVDTDDTGDIATPTFTSCP